MITVDPDLTRILAVTPLTSETGFVAHSVGDKRLDTSAIAFDQNHHGYWIASDTGQSLFFVSPPDWTARRFGLHWQDGHMRQPIHNAEDISLDASGKKLFVVSDDGKLSRVFAFKVE